MTTKEYLRQIYDIQQHIKRLEQRKAAIEADLYSVKAITISPDKVMSSSSHDRMLSLIAKHDRLVKGIEEDRIRLFAKRRKIMREVERVPEPYKTLLHERYELCWTWEQIAEDMHTSVRHIYRLHGRALYEFEKIR